MLAELLGDGSEVRVSLARETVAQTPFLVSGIGEIEAGLAFEGRLSTRYSLPCQADSQQRISYGRTFTHGSTAAAASFEVTRSQVHALGECAVNLSCIEAHDLGGSNRGPEDAEHGTGMKSPRQDGRDEIRPQSFHDLVAGHYSVRNSRPEQRVTSAAMSAAGRTAQLG